MKSILKYLSPLCPCPLSLFLCRSFLSVLKSTQPCFWGLLQALSCPSHPQSVVPMGCSLPAPLSRFLISDESFIAKLLLLAPSAASPPSAHGALSCAGLGTASPGTFTLCWLSPAHPSCSLLDHGNWETIWHRATAKAGAGLDGSCLVPAQPSLLLACSWRVPSVLGMKTFHGRLALQDCKYRVHEPTELSRTGMFICERIFHKQSEKPISLCMFGAWD